MLAWTVVEAFTVWLFLGAEPRAACVSSAPYTRPGGYGFNHVVALDNHCEVAMRCIVTTDVSPQPVEVTIARGEKKDVTTFMASPSRTFLPSVDCKPAP